MCVPEVVFFKVLLYLNPDFSFEVTDAKNHTYIWSQAKDSDKATKTKPNNELVASY